MREDQRRNSAPKALLDGKVAVVTDGGHEAGRGIALAMAFQGARLVLNDPGTSEKGESTPRAVEEVVENIRAGGGKAVATAFRTTTIEGSNRLVQSCLSAFGSADILVHTSRPAPDQNTAVMDETTWRTGMTGCLKSAFCCTRAVAPHMRSRRWGRLIYLVSADGLIGGIGHAALATASMAVCGLSRNVAIEMARYNVTSNCIAPVDPRLRDSSVAVDTATQTESDHNRESSTRQGLASLAIFISTENADPISGQVFGVRGNEIYLFCQSRIVRSIHNSRGWTAEALSSILPGSFRHYFVLPEDSSSYFAWKTID
jgi:NAD(P)-dependent dehydrogenase (short-subunit alcohol dehydrogenase family)